MLEQSAVLHLRLDAVPQACCAVLLSWPPMPALHNCFPAAQLLGGSGTWELLLGCSAPFLRRGAILVGC